MYEEPRLREQDFGNFQPCSAEMERIWQERADYGHFFYRIPNGESAADAYDRISGFNESLWRQFGEDDFPSVCVLVTHGMMSRVFLMKWYHFSVEYFEDLRNINHCEFLVMRKQENGKYLLENKLRTWSELRKERSQANIADGSNATNGTNSKDDSKGKQKHSSTSSSNLNRSQTIIPKRRWGGCPNGCNHTSHYKRRTEDQETTRQAETEQAMQKMAISSSSSLHVPKRPYHYRSFSSDGDDEHSDAFGQADDGEIPSTSQVATPRAIASPKLSSHKNTSHLKKLDPSTASSSTMKPLPLPHDHLHIGRDFGGSYSGHASASNSEVDHSEEDDAPNVPTSRHRHHHHHHNKQPMESLDERIKSAAESVNVKTHTKGLGIQRHQQKSGTIIDKIKGDRLGDIDPETEGENDKGCKTLEEAEREDKSVRGSVY